MSTTPLVSIGLFLYNGDRFLAAAIESILNQTFTGFRTHHLRQLLNRS